MYPRLSDLLQDLFGITSPVPLYSYGATMAMAFLVAAWLMRKQHDRLYATGRVSSILVRTKDGTAQQDQSTHSVSPSVLVVPLTVVAMISGILGAKLFFILEHPTRFLANPSFMIFSLAGLTFYGGLIMATFCVTGYGRWRGLPVPACLEAAAPGLMLAYGIGRIGCHLAGDGDWGIPADLGSMPDWLPTWLWAETYPNNTLGIVLPAPGVYPTPLYEFGMCAMLFGVLWVLRRHPFLNGWLFSWYLVFNGVERFLIEQIRVNPTFELFGLVVTQAELISVPLFLIGLIGLSLTTKRRAPIRWKA